MRNALVTGASSGIGRAIAQALLEHGWNVSGVSRDPGRAGLAGLHGIAANLMDEDACIAAVAAHRERFGGLDLLVNSSGIGIGGPLDEYPTRWFDRQFAINVRGLFIMTRECLPMLRESRGMVVNLSSVAGLQGVPMLAAYSATKHAVIGLTRSLNVEQGDAGIRATAICPGYVATPMTEGVQGSIPPEQMIQPEDVARVVLTLVDLSPNCVLPEIELLRAGSLGSALPI